MGSFLHTFMTNIKVDISKNIWRCVTFFWLSLKKKQNNECIVKDVITEYILCQSNDSILSLVLYAAAVDCVKTSDI